MLIKARNPMSCVVFLAIALSAGGGEPQQKGKAQPKGGRDLRLEKLPDDAPVPARSVTGQGDRRALVIGNASYRGVTPLRNPLNDAADMAVLLRRFGFEVTHLSDAPHARMKDEIRRFTGALKPGSTALFYFAGHGMQVDNENYLIPVDFVFQSETAARQSAVAAGAVQQEMESANAGINLLIFDACRNNPFRAKETRRGLSPMDTRLGTLVAFATGPGQTADENPSGRNGLYTKHLLKAMEMPLDLVSIFRQTRQEVFQVSGGRQSPWFHEDILQAFQLQQSGAQGTGAKTILQAQELYLQRDFAKAAAAFEQTIRQDSQNAFAQNGLGAAYSAQGMYAPAIERFNRAIQLKLDYSAAYYNRGLAYLQISRFEQAVDDFTWALEQDPQNPVLLKLRGRAYLGRNDYEQALADLNQSLTLNASDPETLLLRGSVYNRTGKYKEASEDLTAAIALKANFCEAYKARQYARTRLRDAKAADDAAMAAKVCR